MDLKNKLLCLHVTTTSFCSQQRPAIAFFCSSPRKL